MNDADKTVGAMPRQPIPVNGGPVNLSPEQKAFMDYAVAALSAVNQAQTEEIVTRTKHGVHTEINNAFETYTKLTTTRRIWLALGAAMAFGGGFLIKGWLRPKQLPESNGVNTESMMESARKY